MIEEWPGISEARSKSLRRIEQFVARHDLPPDTYAYVMTAKPPNPARYVVRYGIEDDDGLNAVFESAGLRAQVSCQTGLSLLCVLAVDIDMRGRLAAIDDTLDVEAALPAFAVDAASHLKPHLGRWEVGAWIAPDRSGFVVFDVDWRGEVTVLARANAVGAAFVLAVTLRDQAAGIRRQADTYTA